MLKRRQMLKRFNISTNNIASYSQCTDRFAFLQDIHRSSRSTDPTIEKALQVLSIISVIGLSVSLAALGLVILSAMLFV